MTLRSYVAGANWSGFRTAVSLHSHTLYSCEAMSDLPRYIEQIPIVASCFRLDRREQEASPGAVDFTRGWWHPPSTPRQVFESELRQVDRRFGIDAIVSVTDHDDIAAGLELQKLYAVGRAPISFEWTVPFGAGFYHLGLHNLQPGWASAWFERLSAFTEARSTEDLATILSDLTVRRDLLVVFNHPLWDLACVGKTAHGPLLREFLEKYGRYIHALEINGYRARSENSAVRTLSAETGIPLISGGDRHTLAPNAVLNLTSAQTFAEFVDEIRDGISHIVVMPEYRHHVVGRKLQSAAEALALYREYPSSRRRWLDRVSYPSSGTVQQLSSLWPAGGPFWLRATVGAFKLITSPIALPLVSAVLKTCERPRAISLVPLNG